MSSVTASFIDKQKALLQKPLTEPRDVKDEDKKAFKKALSALNKSISTRRSALLHVSRSRAVCEQIAILADQQAIKRRKCEKKGVVELSIDENQELEADWIDALPLEWGGDECSSTYSLGLGLSMSSYRDALARAKEQQRRKKMLEEQIEHYEELLRLMQ